MDPLPPWLNVSPRDFVLAAAQGAQLGHQIADSTMRAWEEQARMRMASQEAAARREQAAYQHEVETAANRLAADRLEQYRQQEIQNAKAELGLRGQGLDIQRQGLTMRGEREADLQGAREARIKDAEQAARDKLAQVDFNQRMSEREQDRRDKDFERRQQEAGRARGTAHYLDDESGAHYVVMPGSTNAVPINFPKGEKGDTGSSGNYLSNLLGIAGPVLKAATIGGGVSMTPQLQPSFAPQETQAAPPPITLAPKKRVRVKGPNGQTGTIEEGANLPDGWTVTQ